MQMELSIRNKDKPMISSKDLSNALYALSKAKGYAATVILTLGLTLGTLVAMFNLNYQILAAPLPYADEESLVVGSTAWLEKDGSVLYPRMMPSGLIQQFYDKPSDKLSNHALLRYQTLAMTLHDLADSPSIHVSYTTPGFMQMFQMQMLHGRGFSADEDIGNNNAVAVLTEQVWRHHYNADPALVGRQVRIGDIDFTVVGIAAATFSEPQLLGPARHTDVWLPWDMNPKQQNSSPATLSGWHFYLGQLKNSADRQAFEQEIGPALNSKFQDANIAATSEAGRTLQFNAEPLRLLLQGDSSSRTLWMLAGSLLLLLIATANITHLLLSRAAKQQRTMSIQAALGAQRHHLFSQTLAELVCLLTAALLLALVVAQSAYLLLKNYAASTLPRLSTLSLDWPTLMVALFTTTLLALLFSRLISRQINYKALQQNLQSSGKGIGIQISGNTRQLLICSQIALAAMLLVCSAQVLLQSLAQLRQPIGFSSEQRFEIALEDTTPIPDSSLSTEQRTALSNQHKDELMQIAQLFRQHPAVLQASVSNDATISYTGTFSTMAFLPVMDNSAQIIQSRIVTTDQYFLPLLNLQLLQGRNFSGQEVKTRTPVVIINRAFAEHLQAGGEVLGRRLYSRLGQAYEIIGISANHNLPDKGSSEEPFISYISGNLINNSTLLLHLKPGMRIDKTALNKMMAQVSPHYRAANIYSIASNVNRVLFNNYLAAAVTSALVVLSFVLAAIGIYGVLSYSVQLRRFELGVRMAIGARPATILRQLLGENLKPVLAGLALASVGLAALWFALQKTTFTVELSGSGFALPLLLIVLLTVLTTLLSVWSIIRKPAVYALQGR
jgi:predicted permease